MFDDGAPAHCHTCSAPSSRAARRLSSSRPEDASLASRRDASAASLFSLANTIAPGTRLAAIHGDYLPLYTGELQIKVRVTPVGDQHSAQTTLQPLDSPYAQLVYCGHVDMLSSHASCDSPEHNMNRATHLAAASATCRALVNSCTLVSDLSSCTARDRFSADNWPFLRPISSCLCEAYIRLLSSCVMYLCAYIDACFS
jgi:hypothetical protein